MSTLESPRSHNGPRAHSYGQVESLSSVDRFGVWLSHRRIVREVGSLSGKRVGDFGCGYQASFVRSVLRCLDHAVLVDVNLAADLPPVSNVTAIEGVLPEALEKIEDDSLDVVLCISVLEHLWDPVQAITEFRRVLAPGGTCIVNVPTWRAKWFLELSAFKLGLSPRSEIDDHKSYYDPSDLWPLLVRGGFLPHNITCSRHKFGLNTIAVCTRDLTAS